MYLNILKKDLKRKRAMNIILLVFIILASMFVSSGVSNILTVTTALDRYFEMADVPDYFALYQNKASDKDVYKVLENASAIDEFRIEEGITITQSNITRKGEPLDASNASQQLAFSITVGFIARAIPKPIGISLFSIMDLLNVFYILFFLGFIRLFGLIQIWTAATKKFLEID